MNWDSFKWRNSSPDLGRFWVIDPIAEKYVHNSPYAFSENRVIDAIEFEGLEAIKITDLKNNRVDVEVRFQTTNNTDRFPITNQEINVAVESAINQAENSFSGQTSDGMNVTFTFIQDPNATITVNFLDNVIDTSIDVSDHLSQYFSYLAPEFVDANSIGNTQSGTIQVSSMNSSFNGESTFHNPEAGSSINHGFGHIFGLKDNNPRCRTIASCVPRAVVSRPSQAATSR